jgi:hypothetical protein
MGCSSMAFTRNVLLFDYPILPWKTLPLFAEIIDAKVLNWRFRSS